MQKYILLFVKIEAILKLTGDFLLQRAQTGIPGLDELVEGGLPVGRVALLIGGPGSGKTIFGMQFLVEGAKRRENGLFVTLAEHPEHIIQNVSRFGWGLENLLKENKIRIINATPVALEIEREEYVIPIATQIGYPKFSTSSLLNVVKEQVKALNAKRLVIDSITSLKLQFEKDMRIRQSVLDFIKSSDELKCTTLLTSEVGEPKGIGFLAEEYLAHSVIRLHNFLIKNHIVRAIQILKMRGTMYEHRLYPYKITNKGIVVFPKEKVVA